MKAICIDKGDADLLQEQQEYFIFPNGESHVYVSKFDNSRAYFGCYQKELFKEVTEEAPIRPPEPPELDWKLDPQQTYKALLVWTSKRGYWSLEGKHYYLKKYDRSPNQVWYYADPECKKLRGICDDHWFIDYEPIEVDLEPMHKEIKEVVEILPENEWEQMSLF